MGALINIIGIKYGRLVVLEKAQAKSRASAYWLCKCECGNITVAAGCKLKSGHTSSCGCKKLEALKNNRYKHGQANSSRTYKTWKEMRNRCNNKNAYNYKWYGGRGIIVCESWNSYPMFLLDMGERPQGHTIDRIDSDGSYEKSNCRWATPKQQAETNRGCFKKKKPPVNTNFNK